MAITRYTTAGALLNAAAIELGLSSVAVADPVGSFPQLMRFLARAGQGLARRYDFRHLHVEWLFTTGVGEPTPGAGIYDLPADFIAMVPGTAWDRAAQRPLYGPMSAQLWQYRKAVASTPVYAEFRLDTNQLRLYPAPPTDGIQVAVEYRSRAWVRPVASGLGNGNTLGPTGEETPTVAGDFLLFDEPLILAATKLLWKSEKGFDTTTALTDFATALTDAQEATAGRPVLDLAGGSPGFRLLGVENVPSTGY